MNPPSRPALWRRPRTHSRSGRLGPGAEEADVILSPHTQEVEAGHTTPALEAGKEQGGSPKRQPLQSPRAQVGERQGGHTGQVLPPGLPAACVFQDILKAPPSPGSQTASDLPGPPPTPLSGSPQRRCQKEPGEKSHTFSKHRFQGRSNVSLQRPPLGSRVTRLLPPTAWHSQRHAAPQLWPPRSLALACVFPLPPTQAPLPGQS